MNSEALNKCFGFQVTTTFSNDSFAKKLLNGIDFEDKVDDIKSLSRTLVFKNPISDVLYGKEPGTVFRFDVDVVCESGTLKVIERVSIWYIKIYKVISCYIITQHSQDLNREAELFYGLFQLSQHFEISFPT